LYFPASELGKSRQTSSKQDQYSSKLLELKRMLGPNVFGTSFVGKYYQGDEKPGEQLADQRAG
jgi:hypothetical protein